jgi:hypothetical protein
LMADGMPGQRYMGQVGLLDRLFLGNVLCSPQQPIEARPWGSRPTGFSCGWLTEKIKWAHDGNPRYMDRLGHMG